MSTLIAQQGDTLDLICHRHYGRTAGVTEAVMKANPGLAALGTEIPMGTRVELPEISEKRTITPISLWS